MSEEEKSGVKRIAIDSVDAPEFVEYVEVTYKKTDSERAPKIEMGFRMVVARDNISAAIDEIARELAHMREMVIKSSAEGYYGQGGQAQAAPTSKLNNRKLTRR